MSAAAASGGGAGEAACCGPVAAGGGAAGALPPSAVPEPPLLAAWDTVLPADAVEVCPSDATLLACCTYLLETATDGAAPAKAGGSQRKRGAIKLLALTPRDGVDTCGAVEVALLHSADTDAVFDAKWLPAPSAGPQLLLAATSGCAGVHAFELAGSRDGCAGGKDTAPRLQLRHHVQLAPDAVGTSALSVALLPPVAHAAAPVAPIAVSRSDGRVTVTSYCATAGFDADGGARSWLAHTYDGATPAEVWTVAGVTAPHGATTLLWSGADDGLLKAWDTRASARAPAWTNRAHEAGVCAIEQHPTQRHLVASGSYDQLLRVWDQRNMAAPLAAVDTGGGVWRIRWHPTLPATAVAACMYAGAAVYSLSPPPPDDAATPWLPAAAAVTHMQCSHSSIVYGAAWLPGLGASPTVPIASCSFYDHALHLWRAPALTHKGI